MADDSTLEILGLNSSRLILGTSILLPVLLFFIGLPDNLFTYPPNLFLTSLFAIIAGVLGTLTSEFIDRLIYIYLRLRLKERGSYFPFFFPWDSWNDSLFQGYKFTILTRVYFLLSAVILSLSLIYYALLPSNWSSPSLDYTRLNIEQIVTLLFFLFIFFLLIFLSLSRKIGFSFSLFLKPFRFLRWQGSWQRSEIDNLPDDITHLFEKLENLDDIIDILNQYVSAYGHNFQKKQRVLNYLNLISVIHINNTIFEELKSHLFLLENKRLPEIIQHAGKSQTKEEYLHRIESIRNELKLVEQGTKLAHVELEKHNFEEARQHFIIVFHRFRNFIKAQRSEDIFRLATLARDSNPKIREKVAGNINTPEDVLEKLAFDPYVSVRKEVAKNRNTTPLVLDKLASDSYVEIRETVAANSHTRPSTLEKLMHDPHVDVQTQDALNKNSTPQILDQLVEESDLEVWRAVARNRRTSRQTLKRLSQESNYIGLLAEVARNNQTSPDVLDNLSSNASSRVRTEAARNWSTRADILHILAKDASISVRTEVAGNKTSSPDTLELLSNDSLSSVQVEVAKNLNTNKETLAVLAHRSNYVIRLYVAQNPNSSVSTLFLLAKDKDERVRRGVAQNPSVTESILSLLANDPNSEIRELIAQNDNTPMDALILLEHDESDRVSTLARRSISVTS